MTDKQREVIIKAAVNFGGVWPDDSATHILFNGEIFDWAVFNGHYSRPSFDHFVGFVISASEWLPICNRQEFKAFMDDLSDKAPDGAECAGVFDGKIVCYYRNIEDDRYEYHYTVGGVGGVWDEIFGKPAQEQLIPIPKRKPAPWMPEIGRECEYYSHEMGERRKGLIHCKYKQGFIVIDDEYETPSIAYSHNLQRLRTKAEIEHERLYNEIFALDVDMDDYQINRVIEFIQGRDNE